jgi:hypothetical protein
MSHLLVPGDADASSATAWVAAIDEDSDASTLEIVAATGERVGVGAWEGQPIRGGNHEVRFARPRLQGLPQRVRRSVELRRGGQVLATAAVRTLPDHLPGIGERPFTILLGSCFSRPADDSGSVGRAYKLLPTDARPDIKILCGDQVYLDAPSFWTVTQAVNDDDLDRRLLEAYLRTWMQSPGLQDLLTDGPNLFTSDDHDFWNNAPNWSVTAPATLRSETR